MHARTTARVVGALFLTATAAGVLSVVLLGPLSAPTGPPSTVDGSSGVVTGALMVLVMAGAIALIPPVLFPVLEHHGEALALGYVVARTIEVVLLLPSAVMALVLVAVGTRTDAGAAAAGDTVLVLWQTQGVWLYGVHSVFFCLGALLLNVVFYRSGLVPRWIAAWALVAVVPYLADAGLMAFGVLTLSSAVHTLLILPLALNEMVLAVWLLTRGFRAPSRALTADAAAGATV